MFLGGLPVPFIDTFIDCVFNFYSSLCFLAINPLPEVYLAKTSSRFVGCPFIPVIVLFVVWKCLDFISMLRIIYFVTGVLFRKRIWARRLWSSFIDVYRVSITWQSNGPVCLGKTSCPTLGTQVWQRRGDELPGSKTIEDIGSPPVGAVRLQFIFD